MRYMKLIAEMIQDYYKQMDVVLDYLAGNNSKMDVDAEFKKMRAMRCDVIRILTIKHVPKECKTFINDWIDSDESKLRIPRGLNGKSTNTR